MSDPRDPANRRAGATKMHPAFYVLLILLAAYAAWFIARTSFEVGGTRYFSLFDDAMISMRYARNLADGHGLVWNAGGEPVEGFTNPLWVVYMTLVHLLPISLAHTSLWIQVTEAVCLILTVVMVRRLSLALFPRSMIAEYVPAVMTAAYIPLLNWSLQGMEVGPLALLLVWSAYAAVKGVEEGKVPALFYWALGAATLLRLDSVPLAFVLLAAIMLADPVHRRHHLLQGGSILVLFLLVQTAARFFYYGELLPNTYFLKVTGIPALERFQRGITSFLGFVSGMGWIVFLFPFILFVLSPPRGATILAALFLAQCAYSISVGGDVWEWWGGSNRYLSVVMPFFFILFGGALARLHALYRARLSRQGFLQRYAGGLGVVLIVLISLFRLNQVKGAATASDWVAGGLRVASSGFSESGSLARWLLMPEPLEQGDNLKMAEAAMLLDSITLPGARVAVVRAGTLSYFSDREFIDMLGKSDKVVARLASRASVDPMGKVGHTPGHSKWSYAYSLGECKPDVIYELWAAPQEAEPFLEADYQAVRLRDHTWYVRRASAYVRREMLPPIPD